MRSLTFLLKNYTKWLKSGTISRKGIFKLNKIKTHPDSLVNPVSLSFLLPAVPESHLRAWCLKMSLWRVVWRGNFWFFFGHQLANPRDSVTRVSTFFVIKTINGPHMTMQKRLSEKKFVFAKVFVKNECFRSDYTLSLCPRSRWLRRLGVRRVVTKGKIF